MHCIALIWLSFTLLCFPRQKAREQVVHDQYLVTEPFPRAHTRDRDETKARATNQKDQKTLCKFKCSYLFGSLWNCIQFMSWMICFKINRYIINTHTQNPYFFVKTHKHIKPPYLSNNRHLIRPRKTKQETMRKTFQNILQN